MDESEIKQIILENIFFTSRSWRELSYRLFYFLQRGVTRGRI